MFNLSKVAIAAFAGLLCPSSAHACVDSGAQREAIIDVLPVLSPSPVTMKVRVLATDNGYDGTVKVERVFKGRYSNQTARFTLRERNTCSVMLTVGRDGFSTGHFEEEIFVPDQNKYQEWNLLIDPKLRGLRQ